LRNPPWKRLPPTTLFGVGCIFTIDGFYES
jgi:hypothetical protein